METLHPSDYIMERLRALKWSQSELVRASGISRSRMSKLLARTQGHGVTPLLAVRLEKALGRKAEEWLRLQLEWDLRQKIAKLREAQDEALSYAVDEARNVLVEASASTIAASSNLRPVGRIYAQNWVKYGDPHETPLYVGEDGRVKRARKGV